MTGDRGSDATRDENPIAAAYAEAVRARARGRVSDSVEHGPSGPGERHPVGSSSPLPAYLGLAVLAAYFAMTLAMNEVFALSTRAQSPGGAPESPGALAVGPEAPSLLHHVTPGIAGVLVVIWALRWSRGAKGRPARRAMGCRSPGAVHLVLPLLAGLVLHASAACVHVFGPIPEDMRVAFFSRLIPFSGWQLYAGAAASLLVAPVVEEFVFRGIVYGSFERYGAFVASTVSTAGFVCLRVPPVLLFESAVLFLLGSLPFVLLSLVLCWLRDRNGSIASPIAFRAGNNLAIVVSVLVFEWTHGA